MKRVLLVCLILGCASAPEVREAKPQERQTRQEKETAARHQPLAERCCKICRMGKACGCGCIAYDRPCMQPPGCACDFLAR